jgi:Ni,Fe-hydrogenase III large subunit/Ni,Fe-hydrogenase III component G
MPLTQPPAGSQLRSLPGLAESPLAGNGRFLSLQVDRARLPAAAIAARDLGGSLMTMVATDDRGTDDGFGLRYIFSLPSDQILTVQAIVPAGDPCFPSVTPHLAAAHWYEREARDMFGIVPLGHPDPRRLVLHDDWPHGYHPLRKDVDGRVAPPPAAERPWPFQVIKGEGISEVPVGPIHAGIIEPGHFRFSVVGERVVHLEARLFYVHRGIEKLCEGMDVLRALEVVERICGVCTLSHSLAFCQAVETVAGVVAPPRGVALRTALLELERLYNHVGDTGNLCAGVSLAAGAMTGARIKDDLQSLAERLTGSRYLRGIACPGGLRHDFSGEALADFAATVARAARDAAALERLLLGTDSFMRRLYGTGALPRQAALDLGAVGVAARASGVARDIRLAHPFAAYGAYPPALCTEPGGDVHARFRVRLRELQESARLIDALLTNLPGGAVRESHPDPVAGSALGWTESPRGEHVHWLRLGPDGRLDRLRVRAASYCNWPVVPLTVPGNMVPDFPLINKSFELCYSCLDR